jgi:hypothetical protein
MKKIVIFLTLFALIVVACEALGVNANDESNTVVEKITPSPEKAAMALEAEPVIVFQRSGGFAGVSEQWSIYASGKISKQGGEDLTVDPAKVTALMEALQTAGFYDMKASSGKTVLSNCKDCFTYQLTVTGAEKANTITFQEGAKDIPEAILNIMNQINDLVASPDTQ